MREGCSYSNRSTLICCRRSILRFTHWSEVNGGRTPIADEKGLFKETHIPSKAWHYLTTAAAWHWMTIWRFRKFIFALSFQHKMCGFCLRWRKGKNQEDQLIAIINGSFLNTYRGFVTSNTQLIITSHIWLPCRLRRRDCIYFVVVVFSFRFGCLTWESSSRKTCFLHKRSRSFGVFLLTSHVYKEQIVSWQQMSIWLLIVSLTGHQKYLLFIIPEFIESVSL